MFNMIRLLTTSRQFPIPDLKPAGHLDPAAATDKTKAPGSAFQRASNAHIKVVEPHSQDAVGLTDAICLQATQPCVLVGQNNAARYVMCC